MKQLPTMDELYSCRPSFIWQQVKSEHICFWFVCGYLFFEYVRPQSIYPIIDFFPWTAFFAVAAFISSFLDNVKKPKKASPLNKLVLAFGGVTLLSSAASEYPDVSFSKLDAYWTWVIIYFAIVRIVHTPQRFFIFLLLYLLCNLKMSQHGFLSWASRGFAFADWGVTGGPGWFHNSGEFGIQLCIYVPLATCFILALRQHWSRFFKLVFYFMPISGVGSAIATSSRGALVGLLAAGAWAAKSSKYFWRAVIGVTIVVFIGYLLTPPEFKERFTTAGEDKTSLHRLDRWESGLETLGKFPLLGVGHKAWEPYFWAHLSNYSPRGSAMVHNFIIECATEQGLLGVFVLALILLYMFRVNKRVRDSYDDEAGSFHKLISYGFDLGVIGFMVSASFVTVLYYPYIWIQAALISCLYHTAQKEVAQ